MSARWLGMVAALSHLAGAQPSELPPLPPEKPLPVPDVVTSTLPNGLAIWSVTRADVPLVKVRLAFRGGRALDAPDSAGFADLLAAALREGTEKRTGAEVASLLQGAGAELGTVAGDDQLVLSAGGISSKLDLIVDVLADVARHPSFPAKDIARLKALALEDLARNETDPFFLAERAFRSALYGSHPYARVSPTKESIEVLSPESLRHEAARRFQPARALLLVVGDVSAQAVRAAAERAFGDFAPTVEAAPDAGPALAPAGPPVIRVVDRPESVQTNLTLGTLGISRNDPDAVTLGLAVSIYGGAFSSRLVSNLREEKGYTYSPGAASRWARKGGSVETSIAVRNEVTGAAFAEVLHEMNRMGATDVTDEELARGQRHDAGAYAVSLQTQAGLAAELLDLWLNDLAPAEISRMAARLAAVTKSELRRVSRKYLATGYLRVAAVGNAKVIREELEPMARVAE